MTKLDGSFLFKTLGGLPAVLVLLTATPAYGQGRADPLGEVVAEAVRNNLGLAREDLAVQAAAAGVREARAGLLPSLEIDGRYSEQTGTLNLGDFVNPANAALNDLIGENRFPTNLDVTLPYRHESRVRLTQTVFNPAVLAAYAQSRHGRDAQRLTRQMMARRLAAEAQTAWLTAAAARSARGTWKATLALVEENERVAERLVDAGDATPDAVFRARAERAEVEQELAEARDTEGSAVRAFNQILRRPLDAPLDHVPDSALRFVIPLTEEQAVANALARREELAGTAAAIRAAEAGVRVEIASFLPNVALAVDYGFQGSRLRFGGDRDFAVASVIVSWNVFNGGRDLARRQRARIATEQLQLRRMELEDQVRLDVRQAYGAAVVAGEAIATAETRLAASRRTFELVRRRYEEGMATHVEFLDARTALTNAELNRVNTVYRYAIRYVDLERAAALRTLP